MAKKITVKDLLDNTRLTVVTGGEYLDRPITTENISRPGLEMTGYFNYYAAERVQLMGITETSFAQRMSHEEKLLVARKMMSAETPVFVVSTGRQLPEEFMQAANEAQIPVLATELTSSRILSNMTYFLSGQLAERQSVHGVLVDIFGLGVLITGDSGVGKSETALELIQRGHRLIADDRVDIYQQDEERLVGEAPAILKNLMELRGVGIIDVLNLFGAGAVRNHATISFNLHLAKWEDGQVVDRLGNGEDSIRILDVDLPRLVLPVQTGRNLAILIETAAKNFRAKQMGFDATETFNSHLNSLITENSN
ncbi:HPr(Ser) kinase/phosphatase [Weissella soli]|jgi:HPr kinase/phosphorylase|uniref:HPr kinase/phosphorylase n=2 Tax=Weissella soli TaxID=155866 RepID=A0A288QNR4_9LACO|nr:HPr(Ser) kinase/phosphatase [Weissella soli]AOT56856.1 HPr kinase/phosphorylase [Weissella soli]NKY83307.1 HPr kinase/phosphorylase [Weissella soli]QEA34248.1 HPr kinase/phosphorylase [Weissella soli]RDL05401.1 Hpr(Ser) kinase/phosphatase [Weissella soli]GEN93558.1 HPr kinase/phosphorylase [Weissella soli]